MRAIFLAMLWLTVFSNVVVAEEEGKPNCKLTTQTLYKGGKKKLNIEEVFTPTRELCSAEAASRRLAVTDDEEQIDRKVVFSWMETR